MLSHFLDWSLSIPEGRRWIAQCFDCCFCTFYSFLRLIACKLRVCCLFIYLLVLHVCLHPPFAVFSFLFSRCFRVFFLFLSVCLRLDYTWVSIYSSTQAYEIVVLFENISAIMVSLPKRQMRCDLPHSSFLKIELFIYDQFTKSSLFFSRITRHMLIPGVNKASLSWRNYWHSQPIIHNAWLNTAVK